MLANFAKTYDKESIDGEDLDQYVESLLKRTKYTVADWAILFGWLEEEDEIEMLKEERRLWLERWKANEDDCRRKNIKRLKDRIREVREREGVCVCVFVSALLTNFQFRFKIA